MTIVLEANEVSKSYWNGSKEVRVLNDVSFAVTQGETVAVVGPSGSGKTTLLSCCAGLENPDMGTIRLLQGALHEMSEDDRARLRNRRLGFIFQSFHLMPSLTALENVMLPLEILGESGAERRASELLGQIGLDGRLNHYPAQLSGGEQQRVAIARAFINDPVILFADEPTGNLDRETGERVNDLLFELNRDRGATLLLITHDLELAERTGRTFRIVDGALTEEASTLAGASR